LNCGIEVESEDAFLRFILKLGLVSRNLLKHIEIGFLSEEGLSLLNDLLPPESVWKYAVEWIARPLLSFDS
jgi:hypothetical protein